MTRILSKHLPGKGETRIVLTVDDVLLRNEWVDDVPTISLDEMKPEEDLAVPNMLEDLNIDATLFVCGRTAELFPDVIKKLSENFEIAAHGYRHENFHLLKEPEKRRRTRLSMELIEKCINKRVFGWRSPGLHIDTSLYKSLEDTHILWCSDIEIPLFFRYTPFTYFGKVELPIAIIDLKLYNKGLSLAKVRQHLLSLLDRGGNVFTIIIHPWVQLRNRERLKVLRDFLETAQSSEKVRLSSGLGVYKQFILRENSAYATTLSAVSGLWKRLSSPKL